MLKPYAGRTYVGACACLRVRGIVHVRAHGRACICLCVWLSVGLCVRARNNLLVGVCRCLCVSVYVRARLWEMWHSFLFAALCYDWDSGRACGVVIHLRV